MAEIPNKVIVSPLSTEPKPRLPIEILMTDDKLVEQRDLFLLGFAAVQQKDDPNDPTSFYQIAGIHGLPYEPYDGVTGTYNKKNADTHWGGYCRHGDILFPTWHRPYIMLLEQCIYNEAKKLVSSIYQNDQRYKEALENLRFPFWDWASPSTLAHGVPSFFSDETVKVTIRIEGKDSKKVGDIPNPLRAYTLPKNLGTMSLVGDQGNPTQRPYVPSGTTTIYTPEGYSTIRHPTENYSSHVEKTSLKVIQDCSTTFRPNVYQIFLVKDWKKFSNHGWDEDPANIGYFASVEVAHDTVHVSVGGNGGHMSDPDTASFDPIFFLHHCNVDRLVALWQACHPDAWIDDDSQTNGTFTDDPDQKIGANTNLTPFRKSDTEFWNSNDVRDIRKLGYTYPTLTTNYTESELLKLLLDYYHPNRYLLIHWQVCIRVKKNYLGYPFTIRVFFDKSDADASTSTSSPNYAGNMYIFARGKHTLCENCKQHPNMVVNGTVDLTLTMQRLGVLENNDHGRPLRGSLDGSRVTLVAVSQNGTDIPLDQIGLKVVDIYRIDTEGETYKYTFINHVPILGRILASES
ncbi:hypothetical protein C1645_821961 [Glomus cerebriforme]|uniref:tyrosinase n=1 Tax=Glomus cerebriforme TaxID=658196 RepID=A0A397SZQ9_9GLOM|nr:hypothetical protein C1645_821961 [Glomus cerebriforme]